MKKHLLIILLFIPLVFVGCDKENEKEDTVELRTDMRGYLFGVDNLTCTISILSGNGGYELVYPKHIQVEDESVSDFDRYIKISLKGSEIYAERLINDETYITANFLLKDSKGQKKVIFFETSGYYGGLLGEYDELEEILINTPDYWR